MFFLNLENNYVSRYLTSILLLHLMLHFSQVKRYEPFSHESGISVVEYGNSHSNHLNTLSTKPLYNDEFQPTHYVMYHQTPPFKLPSDKLE